MAWVDPRTWVAGETLTAALLNAQLRDQLDAAFPAGKIEFFVRAATTSETVLAGGWLECNGVSVLRATYPDLNTLLSGLSYPFGSVDGTHFTLPDLQGRSLVAMSSGGHGDVNALGDSDGVTKASRTPKSAAHTHTGPSHTHTIPAHDHSIPHANAFAGGGNSAAFGSPTGSGGSGNTGSDGTGNTGSGGAVAGSFLVAGCWFIKT